MHLNVEVLSLNQIRPDRLDSVSFREKALAKSLCKLCFDEKKNELTDLLIYLYTTKILVICMID